jgi:predicted phage tail protein
MISVLDLIGEGQIGGLVAGAQSIFFNNTPVQNSDGSWNFSIQTIDPTTGVALSTPTGFAYDFRDGQQAQLPVTGFSDVETPHVLGTKVTQGQAPVVVSITNPNVDAVRLIVSTPSLMFQDTTNGNVSGTTVQFKFEVSVNGGAYAPLSDVLTISGKVSSTYQAAYQYALPKTGAGGAAATFWNIAMTRITPNSLLSNLSNDIHFSDYVEIVNSQLSYPNSALIGMTLNSQEFSSIPVRSYMVNGLYIKVPSNYTPPNMSAAGVWTPAVYTGIWNGTFKMAITSNPAWIMYDLLTETRYGLGQYITPANVNVSALYQIGMYCDGMVSDGFGSLEPRFTINTAIQTQADAYKIISDISSAFRGMAYWRGMVNFTQDAPTAPSMIFTPANVVDGIFNYSGASRKDRHSVVQVTWNDPTQYYKQVIEYVDNPALIAQLGVRKLDVTAFGCTSRGQAHRAGLWILHTEEFESSFITFRVGIDSSLCIPGDVVKIQDPSRAGRRLGGRLIACTATTATLDAPVTLTAGPVPTMSIRLPDGTFADVIINQQGVTTASITWNAALTQVPLPGAMWVIAEANLVPLLARVIGVSQSESASEYLITAVEHNPAKYASIDGGTILTAPLTSSINSSLVVAPTNVTIAEAQYQVAPGTVGLQLLVSWTGQASYYNVTWSRTGANQTNPVTTSVSTPTFDLLNSMAGVYSFTIVAVNMFGIASQPTYATFSSAGQLPPPAAIATFAAAQGSFQINLSWMYGAAVVSSDNVEVWRSATGNQIDATIVTTLPWPMTSYVHTGQMTAGTFNYYIRTKNASGLFSGWLSTSLVYTLDSTSLLTQLNASIGLGQMVSSLATPLAMITDPVYIASQASSATAVITGLLSAEALRQTVNGTLTNRLIATENSVTNTITALGAESLARQALATQTDANIAGVVAAQNALTTTTNSLATQVSTLTTSTGANAAAIAAEATARTDAISSAVTSINTVQANLAGQISGVATTSSANASALTGLSATYTIKAQANGTYAAMQLGSTGVGSAVIFACDKFAISQPNGTGAIPAFQVGTLGGISAVGINGNLIIDGSVTAAQINGNGLAITGNGSFSGNLNAARGTFSGDITGATGTFGGSLSAGTVDITKLVGITTNYLTPGTYTLTVPADKTSMRVTLVGGGGNGTAGNPNPSWAIGAGYYYGAGGTAGAVVIATFNGLTPGATYTLTVGASAVATGVAGLVSAAAGVTGGVARTTSNGNQLAGNGASGSFGGPSAGSGGIGSDNFGVGYGYYGVGGIGYGSGGGGGGYHNIAGGLPGGAGAPGMAGIEFFNPNGVVIRSEYTALLAALTSQGIATTGTPAINIPALTTATASLNALLAQITTFNTAQAGIGGNQI